MTTLQSSQTVAAQHTGDIQRTASGAGAVPSVPEATRVNVTVNQDCRTVFDDGIATFARYQTAANTNAASIEGFAIKLNLWDKEVSEQVGAEGK